MTVNRFEDAVAQKCRMAFYLKPGHKVWVGRHPLYHFCPVTKSNVEFVGGLTAMDITRLASNVIR